MNKNKPNKMSDNCLYEAYLNSVCDVCSKPRDCVDYKGYNLYGETSICEDCVKNLISKKKEDEKTEYKIVTNDEFKQKYKMDDFNIKHEAEMNRNQLGSEIMKYALYTNMIHNLDDYKYWFEELDTLNKNNISNKERLVKLDCDLSTCLTSIKQRFNTFVNDYSKGIVTAGAECANHIGSIESEKDDMCKMLMIACASPTCFCASTTQPTLMWLSSNLRDS
jgi:hypothetical protein